MGKAGKQEQKKGKERKGDDLDNGEDFNELLKELAVSTKNAAEQRAKSGKAKKAMTNDERKEHHKEVHEALAKTKAATMERNLELRNKQMEFQQLLQLMNSGMLNSGLRNTPVVEKSTEALANSRFDVATCGMQGWRSAMEDEHVTDLNFAAAGSNGALFAVFDGHAGTSTSKFAKSQLQKIVSRHYDANKEDAGMTEVFHDLDRELLASNSNETSGSTAVTVLVTEREVICAHVGDSRAVLCRGGVCVSLTDDHKPENEAEMARIHAAGGKVENNRVNGQLAMSRAIGDFSYKRADHLPHHKQLVTCVPDVKREVLQGNEEFLVVACDGIFDVLTNNALVEMIRTLFTENPSITTSEVCARICDSCLAPAGPSGPTRPQGTDNMTITVVRFK